MEQNGFEDYSGARGTRLKEILIKYSDKRTALNKGFNVTRLNICIFYKFKFLIYF